MTDGEHKLLVALVLMVNQYLDKHGDEVDSLSESAGEHVIEALADYGLMESVNARFGRWTEAGKQFRREEAGIQELVPVDYPSQIKLVGKLKPEE
jgi:hypothetical protein